METTRKSIQSIAAVIGIAILLVAAYNVASAFRAETGIPVPVTTPEPMPAHPVCVTITHPDYPGIERDQCS